MFYQSDSFTPSLRLKIFAFVHLFLYLQSVDHSLIRKFLVIGASLRLELSEYLNE